METNQKFEQDDYDYDYYLQRDNHYNALMGERDEDYYRELNEEQFERDLNAYYNNCNDL